MDYKVRLIKQEEIPELNALLKYILDEAFADVYKPGTRRVYEHFFRKDVLLKQLKKQKNVFLGVYHFGKLIGCCILVDKDGGVGFVEWLMVQKDHRGKGLGPMLLKKIQEHALEKKYHYLFLYTETEKNIAFYKKQGFEYVGLQRNSWFGENEHLLQKILRDKPFDEAFLISGN